MADIVLSHSAKGTSWQKKGASYISRVKKNGKWVYTYNNHNVPSNRSINDEMYKADYSGVRHDAKFTKSSPKKFIGKTVKQVSDEHYSNAESLKRKQVSAQRNVQKDTRYKINAKTAYLKNKASRNIKKGKKKVSELLKRLKKQASPIVTKAKKALNNKLQKAVQKEAKAYITNVSTGETREAPTDLFENANMKTTVTLRKKKRRSKTK
jgi:transketolase